MYGWPQYPQKSIREQIEEMEASVKFFKEHFKEEKKPTKWYQTKYSLWEVAFIGFVAAFITALPITVWIITTLIQIKAMLLAL